MVLSFHPLFEADRNILCAGREPGPMDLAAIRKADAVILSQGCRRKLYEIARNNCAHVFPNYDVRFSHAGKIGQIRLFRETGTNHPVTEIFPNLKAFGDVYKSGPSRLPLSLPTVGKFDWGGEGHTVFLIRFRDQLQQFLQTAQRFESSGLTGFLFQEYIPGATRSLRVVIVGRQAISYWRVVTGDNEFRANLSRGAVIDQEADPALQQAGIDAVKRLCRQTGINLAGFDVIFPSPGPDPEPLLLEINYFFGRTGLGGSDGYYQLLRREIHAWLEQIGPGSTPTSAPKQPLP
jgi:ribosomal protein S6--L-glutamate ligase